MIVEIFGPPAVGKTTLSHAIADHLRQGGFGVDLALSYRPSELAGKAGERSTGRPAGVVRVARRLSRPAVETLATARHLLGDSTEGTMAKSLLALMPPVSPMWAIRLRQYIWRLTHSWNNARAAERIVIFDQGFVQAVCSLAVLCAPEHRERLKVAFGMIPRADLLVRVDASVETLRARLLKRERQQGALERMLELDLSSNLRSIEIIDRLEQLLRERGDAMTCVRSGDEISRRVALEWLDGAAARQFATMAVSA